MSKSETLLGLDNWADVRYIQVQRTYTGPMDSELATAMQACDASGPPIVHIAKLYHTSDAQEFRAFGRVMSGTIKQGMTVKVLGEGYSLDDEEDMVTQTIEHIWVNESRSVLVRRGSM